MDNESIAAALLHDVVEDTGVPLSDIEKQFGHEIALLVNGVTKLGRIPYTSKEEQQAENLRKMLLAMAQDIRVVIIKLADRLHNARTFQYLPDEKRRYKALETMEIYAPIADRLGIRRIKEELEDTSLRYLDPIAYEEIESQLTAPGGTAEVSGQHQAADLRPGQSRAPQCLYRGPRQEHLRDLPQGLYAGARFRRGLRYLRGADYR